MIKKINISTIPKSFQLLLCIDSHCQLIKFSSAWEYSFNISWNTALLVINFVSSCISKCISFNLIFERDFFVGHRILNSLFPYSPISILSFDLGCSWGEVYCHTYFIPEYIVYILLGSFWSLPLSFAVSNLILFALVNLSLYNVS